MKVYVGIDLGSTTTKAVILDKDLTVLGRGITNSRSNYDVACAVAKTEAFIDARFHLLKDVCQGFPESEALFVKLKKAFSFEQYLEQKDHFLRFMLNWINDARYADVYDKLMEFYEIFSKESFIYGENLYMGEDEPKSDFFRDIISFCYTKLATDYSNEKGFFF